MRRAAVGTLLAVLAAAGCETEILVPVQRPAAPENLDAYYYAGAVYLTWELGSGWDRETFRVYARRVSDRSYLLIAEVSSCAKRVCGYVDRNIVPGQSYSYYVAAVNPDTGAETASAYSVEVAVPHPVPPPVPAGVAVVALDNANFVRWSANARSASDFSFYRVYLRRADGGDYLLGETDSEGFLDLLAANGTTYRYFVTAVDDQGHESTGSLEAAGTPRPDYSGEWIYAFQDVPASSGFRFQTNESANPVVAGTSPTRHFRLEVDNAGWWLVPGPGTELYPVGFQTTALRCGPAADGDCSDVARAPTSGYVTRAVALAPQTSYVLRVRGDDGLPHYGVIRVALLGFDQQNRALMIFDWAYQLQANNPALVSR